MTRLLKKYQDWFNLLSLLFVGLSLLGGFAAWCEGHFAKEEEVSDMKGEIHQIYELLIEGKK